jgi:hypothetical protein
MKRLQRVRTGVVETRPKKQVHSSLQTIIVSVGGQHSMLRATSRTSA